MKENAFFVFVCFLMYGLLATLFPISNEPNTFIFVSNLGFCAMVLTLRKYSLLDGLLFAGCFGLFYDFFFANTDFINFIIYIMMAWLVYIWRKHMTETMIESIVLCISTIFVKELLLYCIAMIQEQTIMTFENWFVYREFMTITINALLVFVLVSVIRVKDDFLLSKEIKIRKEEKIEWLKFISKR